MIENTAILKIIGCGVVATGTAGGGYYAHTTGVFNFEYSSEEKEEIKDYLIVKSVAHNQDDLKENIYEQDILGNLTKNFKCELKITSPKTDDKCEIYKLSDSEKKLAVAINNNIFPTTSSIKLANNFFKLKVSDEINKAISKWDDQSETIEIKQKLSANDSKVFGKFISIYKVEGGKITKRKTSLAIAKVVENTGTSVTQPTTFTTGDSKNYQCQITVSDKKEKFDCDIKEIEFESTKKTLIFKQDNTTNPIFKEATKDNLKVKDKHFRIVMTEEYLKKIDISNATNTIDIVQKDSSSTETQKFAALTPQFNVLDSTAWSVSTYSFAVLSTGTIGDETDALEENCTVNGKSIPCEIYKFATAQAKTTALKDLDFSSALTAVKSASEVKNNAENYFVVKLKEKSNFLKKETIIQIKNKATPTAKTYSFSSKENIFVDLNTSNQAIGAYIFE